MFGIGVLPAVERHRKGFGELARVLKPGGKIHLFCYGRVWPRNLIRDIVYQVLSRMSLDKQRKAIVALKDAYGSVITPAQLEASAKQ